MATIDWFAEAQNPKVRKMLDVIAKAEGVKHGYNTQFGNTKIDDLSAHPNHLVPFTQTDGKQNKSSAAGRYQFINPTWKDVSSKLGLKDFGPESQDAAAVYLMNEAGALDAVKNGDYSTAMEKLGGTWASLPSSEYAQPKLTKEEFTALINSDNEPGLLEKAVNMVVPTAEASPADEAVEMIMPPDLQEVAEKKTPLEAAKEGFVSGALSPEEFAEYFPEEYEDPLNAFLAGPEASAEAQMAAQLPMALQSLLGPRGAGEVRSQNLQMTNPELAQSFSSMRGNLGSVLPLALGASMSNDTGARSMGKSLLPMAMESMVPTDIGAGLVMPDGTYVTDEPLVGPTGSSSGGSGDEGSKLNPSASEQLSKILDSTKLMGDLTSKVGDDYGGYVLETLADAAKWGKDTGIYSESMPGGMSQRELGWWRNYQRFINQVRNDLYGSALTKTEAAAFEKSIATAKSTPESLRQSLVSQYEILERSLRTRLNMLKQSGYNTAGLENELKTLKENFGHLQNSIPVGETPKKPASQGGGDNTLSDEELDAMYGG